MEKRTPEKITLGSGLAYIVEFNPETGIPSHIEICKPENLLGRIKGGAALSYTEETYEESDDLGYVTKVITTKETASLKLGLITWNGNTLQKLVDRCKVTEENGLRTIHIGGAGNAQGKEWAVCFFHEDKKDGNLWVIVRGRNTAGLSMTYATSGGTQVDPEFKALPQNGDGTLITMIEEMGTVDQSAQQNVEPETADEESEA